MDFEYPGLGVEGTKLEATNGYIRLIERPKRTRYSSALYRLKKSDISTIVSSFIIIYSLYQTKLYMHILYSSFHLYSMYSSIAKHTAYNSIVLHLFIWSFMLYRDIQSMYSIMVGLCHEIVSDHLTWWYGISKYAAMSYHVISYHVMSYHGIIPLRMIRYDAAGLLLGHIIAYQTILYCVMSHRIVWHCVLLYRIFMWNCGRWYGNISHYCTVYNII